MFQLLIGTDLLFLAGRFMAELIAVGGCSLTEHPAPREDLPSIFKLSSD
jgi:hypothetical protein